MSISRPYSAAMIMPRHYIGERTVHDVGNFKEFCGSKDSRDRIPGSSDFGYFVAARDNRKLWL